MSYVCRFTSCGFSSKSEHGLSIHVSMSHPNIDSVVQPYSPKQPRNLRLSAPRGLHGSAKRLPIDRVTAEITSVHSDFYSGDVENEAYMSVMKEVCPEDISIHPIQNSDHLPETVSKGVEEIADAMIMIGQRCSDKICNKLLQCLIDHHECVSSFTDLCQSMVHLREFLQGRQKNEINEEGFERRMFTASNNITCTMFCKSPVEVLRHQVQTTPKSGF